MLKFVKNIFEIIWTLWCLAIAAIIIIANTPIVLLIIGISGQNSVFIDAYLRFFARLILILWGIRMIYIRDPKIDFSRSYIYVSNHRSYLDVFIAVLGIKHYKKFLGKAEVFNWPLIGFLAKKLGHIPVQRESDEAREESFKKILEVAKSNTSLFLCPEGAIYMNARLLNEFRNGAFRVAIESKTPIIAISMINAGELFPPHKIRIRPGVCINYMSAPFHTDQLSLNDLDQLREAVKEEIRTNLEKHYPSKKYPIEFNPKSFKETVYLDTHKEEH